MKESRFLQRPAGVVRLRGASAAMDQDGKVMRVEQQHDAERQTELPASIAHHGVDYQAVGKHGGAVFFIVRNLRI